MPIIWTHELDIGVRTIDLQHRELVDLINAVARLMSEAFAPDQLKQLADKLNQYVLFHFAHEEGMMQRAKLPAIHLDAHFKQHADFAARVEIAISTITDDPAPEPKELYEFLRDWLVNHIIGTDKEFARLVQVR